MATKKKAEKKAAKKTAAPKAKSYDLSEVRKIAFGANSAKGAIDELRSYVINNPHAQLLQLLNDAHTDMETIHNIQAYLKSQP